MRARFRQLKVDSQTCTDATQRVRSYVCFIVNHSVNYFDLEVERNIWVRIEIAI